MLAASMHDLHWPFPDVYKIYEILCRLRRPPVNGKHYQAHCICMLCWSIIAAAICLYLVHSAAAACVLLLLI